MTVIIFCGTPKRVSTVERRVRSTESYALVRSIKAYIQRNSFLPHQFLQPTNHKHHIGGRTVRSETALFLRQDPHALTVLAEVASDDFQKYLAGVRYQQDVPVVAALCPILLFVEYHDDGIFPLLRHLAPPPIRTKASMFFWRQCPQNVS